ncbi:MAG: exonuclease domain-containing protein [Eubacteriales bacterium]
MIGIAGFLDVETTGLSHSYDEIVELAICLFEFKRTTGEITRIVDEYVGLREPSITIPQRAIAVHGIKHHDVKGKRLDDEIIQAMIHKAEFLISHNAPFDRGFVTRLYQTCIQKDWLCSMRGINWKAKGFPSMALQNLLKAHHIQVEKAHRAQDDVKAAIQLLSLSNQNGKPYFSELLKKLAK